MRRAVATIDEIMNGDISYDDISGLRLSDISGLRLSRRITAFKLGHGKNDDYYARNGLPHDFYSVLPNVRHFEMRGTLWRDVPRVLRPYGSQVTLLDLSHNECLLNFLPNMAARFRGLRVLILRGCPRLPRSLQRVWDGHDPYHVCLYGWLLWVSSYHPGLLAVDAYTECCEQQRSVGVILLSRRLFGGVPMDLRRVIVRLMMQRFREQL
jgi:hypothetical protein